MSLPSLAAGLRGSRAGGLLAAAAAIVAITLLLYPLGELDPGVSSGALYVLGVLILATYWGLWLGLLASAASTLALDYFHTSPTGQLLAKEPEDVAALGVLLLTCVVASAIADRARRLGDVSASRARVLEAADRERRRVVRDLHDGAQQRLVQTVLTLKLAREQLDGAGAPARELVAEALEHAQLATGELRELAHGILPAALTSGGLRAGVDALAARMPLPVIVHVPPERFALTAEATAYFVIAEALTNVAKHARAAHVWVSVAQEDGGLEVEVRDDGIGGVVRGGSGMLGMEDRVAAHGGRLAVESPEGGGTRIVASVPLSPARASPRPFSSTDSG